MKVPSDTPLPNLLSFFVTKVMPPKVSTRSAWPNKTRPREYIQPTRVWGSSQVNLENSCRNRPQTERLQSVRKRPRVIWATRRSLWNKGDDGIFETYYPRKTSKKEGKRKTFLLPSTLLVISLSIFQSKTYFVKKAFLVWSNNFFALSTACFWDLLSFS